MFPVNRRIFSRNVFLRRLSRKDAEDYAGLLQKNRDFIEKWFPPLPESLDVARASDWILDEHLQWKRGERLDLGVFLATSGELVGRIALHSISYGIQRSAGVSYWISRSNAGKGIITEALATICSLAFEELLFHRIWLNIPSDNRPSLAVARKLRFRQEGCQAKALFLDGKWRDTIVLAMLEEEYNELAETWIKKKYLGV
ncbi:MAG: [ribosomal protein S5]-alanine N-acetyltransferase [Clostridiales bacterium]|jgi:ribosomal-protein-alanine N-acetyltransferase|nr:[ribosomal protein S5]-alanine N-acetyltransferase [Clostridiales bacterium]MDN5282808.1 [ribosomal protein S5]-alanine N-acetyltransferase [Candidatus Ozemobacter sp.]